MLEQFCSSLLLQKLSGSITPPNFASCLLLILALNSETMGKFSIAVLLLCGNASLSCAAYWHLPVLPDGPMVIQPLPNSSECTFNHWLSDTMNSYILFPEGDHFRWLAAQNHDVMTTTSTTAVIPFIPHKVDFSLVPTKSTTTTTTITNAPGSSSSSAYTPHEGNVSCAGPPNSMYLVPTYEERLKGQAIALITDAPQAPAPMLNVGVPILQIHVNPSTLQVSAALCQPPEEIEVFHWSDASSTGLLDAVLEPGTYAVVKCCHENFFRVLNTSPARLGEAGGHVTLA